MTKKEIIKKNAGNLSGDGYQEVLNDIKSLLDKAKHRAYQAVDNIRVQTYWQVGERIVRAELENKERADYGKYLADNLARDTGFNRRDIYRMIQFFRCYPIVTSLVSQLSWSHYTVLIQLSDKKERLFYESQSIQNTWSRRELEHQIKSELYKRVLNDGEEITIPLAKALKPIEPKEVFKDIYNFDFLKLPGDYNEAELKSGLLDKLSHFLREFGPEFFVGRREVPILIGGNYDRVDLELFHSGLL